MISFTTHKIPINRKLILFSEKPSLKFGLFDVYLQSFYKNTKIGFKRTPKYTKLIDISSDIFIDSFSRSTQYDIRKAKLENIICETSNDKDSFIAIYNSFLSIRKISGAKISEKELSIYGDAFIIRKAYINANETLVFHSYIYDSNIKRVRLLHSVSNNFDITKMPEDKALIGRANKLLHYNDMLYFKEQGCLTYDFGGYAYNTNNKSLIGINSFKDSFGGLMVEESNYVSYLIYLFKLLTNFTKK